MMKIGESLKGDMENKSRLMHEKMLLEKIQDARDIEAAKQAHQKAM